MDGSAIRMRLWAGSAGAVPAGLPLLITSLPHSVHAGMRRGEYFSVAQDRWQVALQHLMEIPYLVSFGLLPGSQPSLDTEEPVDVQTRPSRCGANRATFMQAGLQPQAAGSAQCLFGPSRCHDGGLSLPVG